MAVVQADLLVSPNGRFPPTREDAAKVTAQGARTRPVVEADYDEDLHENHFFKVLQHDFDYLYEHACDKVCLNGTMPEKRHGVC